ncbi:ABC transporter permease [Paenibacillus beijingensis]|uniref:Potassium ABC transporter permease n=1 Tax=Paenibacillus beijingensis TaxID=1126833 RepID=A0A0D5NK61_9BACL|nr:ABC transporter permease [Paenibacillus beijingensis]AJY75525.1 potassium ABC transporter permease [Paenibacillus beijingensis]
MNELLTVIGFTVRSKIKGKAFIVTTLIIAIILSVGINLPYIISQFNSGPGKATPVGYINGAAASQAGGYSESELGGALKKYFETKEEQDVEMVPIDDSGSAAGNETLLKQAVRDGKIKGYLTFSDNGSGFPAVTYNSEKVMESSVSGALKTALQDVKLESVLAQSGLTEAQRALLFSPVSVDSVQISAEGGAGSVGSGRSETEQGVNMGVVYIVIVLLFMTLMGTGNVIASEITMEKSSRVMEVLITSVAPLKQMFGKIIGMLIIGISQIAVYVIVLVLNMMLPTNKDAWASFDISLSDISPALLLYSLLLYVLGYFLYATLYAAVGSLVSRTEDLGQAVMPITFVALAAFYISIFSISRPDSMLVLVSSFIPFFTPFAMVLRIGVGDPPLWHVWVAIAELLAAIYLFGWLSAKIYRTGVLMYGKRPSIKELRKAMKAYKI